MAEKAVATIAEQEASVASAMMLQEPGTLSRELSETALLGLKRLREIIDVPIVATGDEMMDLKQQRLIGDMAIAALKLQVRVDEASLRASADDRVVAALEALAKERGLRS